MPPTANDEDKEIKPINHETIHRICSGQVVISLAIAVKELVENAIDANATNIEIRVKNYGLDSIEVSDDGSGVHEKNFSALTLKHYTSKIQEFSDLDNVATLGFRGEALSSLCALADLTVTTRHESVEHASKLHYDHNGHIKTQSIAARPIGSTVQLSNLFSTLPVRRREFSKNHKREFHKMCSLLHAYCLVCSEIKFTCTNQVNSNKNLILSTQGKGSVIDNIVNIFGAKQTANLFQVPLIQPNEVIATDYSVRNIPETSPFEFEFQISSVAHGSGRAACDRQFYYVNSRPCEPTKLAKLVNETYKMYNSNQFPFVYLDIKVLRSSVDVNVTPDKRQIFLEQEKLLMATVRMSLIEAFKNFPSTYKLQNLNISEPITQNSPEIVQHKRKISDELDVKSFFDRFKRSRVDKDESNNKSKDVQVVEEEVVKCPGTAKKAFIQKPMLEFCIAKKHSSNDQENDKEIKISEEQNSEKYGIQKSEVVESLNETISEETEQNINETAQSLKEFLDKSSRDISTISSPSLNWSTLLSISQNIKTPSSASTSLKLKKQTNITRCDSPTKTQTKHYISLDFTIDSIKDEVDKYENERKTKNELTVKFRCEIAPKTNKDAEQELQKQFHKEMFKEMDIVGQFNYAFIIAKLDQDLFIIDQHASDEKYNFEMLQRHTIMDSQILINPKPLQLTSVDEHILLDNQAIFNKNGFYFKHDPEGHVTERVKLIKLPLSKSTIFGKDDIDEMIYMLKEGADPNCRPSRVRGMFAMRACRKSVMVGKPLNHIAMKKLVDHMGDIEQPWNCPHGRPTMRHLINLNLLN